MFESGLAKDIVLMLTACIGAVLGVYNFVNARYKERRDRNLPLLRNSWQACKPALDRDMAVISGWMDDFPSSFREEQDLRSLNWLDREKHPHAKLDAVTGYNGLPEEKNDLYLDQKSFRNLLSIYRTVEETRALQERYLMNTLPLRTNHVFAGLAAQMREQMRRDGKAGDPYSERAAEQRDADMRKVLNDWGIDASLDVDVRDLLKNRRYRRAIGRCRQELTSNAARLSFLLGSYERDLERLRLHGVL